MGLAVGVYRAEEPMAAGGSVTGSIVVGAEKSHGVRNRADCLRVLQGEIAVFKTEHKRDWGNAGVLARKTKRPRLDLSLGTYVDQPSPKCCSRRSIGGDGKVENGTGVLCPGTDG
jgi:hypothetical protein